MSYTEYSWCSINVDFIPRGRSNGSSVAIGRGLETHLVKAAAACIKRAVPCAAGKGWDARFWQPRNAAAAGSHRGASERLGKKEPEPGGQQQCKVAQLKPKLLFQLSSRV